MEDKFCVAPKYSSTGTQSLLINTELPKLQFGGLKLFYSGNNVLFYKFF